MSRLPRQRRSGFTLIEVGVVMLLMALLIGAAVPAVSSMTGAATRAEIGRLAANIRAARGTAAMTGQTCRMVFMMDGGGEEGASAYSLECTKGRVVAKYESERNDRNDDEEEKDEEHLSDREKERRAVLKRAQFAKSTIIAPQVLPEGLRFSSIWTTHQEDAYKKGKAYLYFYPSGMSERANIQLEQDEDAWTIQVSPLAGRVRVLAGKEELKNQDEDD